MHRFFCHNVGYSCIRGVEVVGEKILVITNAGNSLSWKHHGFKIHIPKNALPKHTPKYLVNIRVSLAGQFELPKGYELVSAVYWVATPGRLTKSVTIEIQHCSTFSKPSQLCFVRTSCTQELLPYKFECIDGGSFIPGNKYGTLHTSHFSGIAIASNVTPGENSCNYCAQVYYTVKFQQTHWYYCHFVITKELEICLKVSKMKL